MSSGGYRNEGRGKGWERVEIGAHRDGAVGRKSLKGGGRDGGNEGGEWHGDLRMG